MSFDGSKGSTDVFDNQALQARMNFVENLPEYAQIPAYGVVRADYVQASKMREINPFVDKREVV